MLLSRRRAAAPTPPAGERLGREILDNGLCLDFVDVSNRYFGDYHRLRIEVILSFLLNESTVADFGLLALAQQRYGREFRAVRVLERMGVAGDAVVATRQAMIEGYLSQTRLYLAKDAAPERLLRAELQKKAGGFPG